MKFIGTILVLALSLLPMWQSDQQKESTFTITLEKTACASTRRMRCSYHFVEISAEKEEKDKRHFSVLFYIGADQAEGKVDAISRLDRFFNVRREVSSEPGIANTGAVGYKKPVTLRIQGSTYEFSHEDGEKIVVDKEKKTTP
jgi:hypothetical protein